MKKPLRHWAAGAAFAAAALAFSSCTYDPNYVYPGSGYRADDGAGYGGSNVSTTVFVSTGDARWGYDPYCYCYYDYHRRCYYDPYLHGYYPIGYRPTVVIGVPHPYGWRPGHGYCPPPRNVSYAQVSNYRNRESAYRSSNYGWAHQVRSQPSTPAYASHSQPNPAARQTSSSSNYARSYGQARPSGGGNPFAGAPTQSASNASPSARNYVPSRQAAASGNAYVPSHQATANGQAQSPQHGGYGHGQIPGYSGAHSGQPAGGYGRPAAAAGVAPSPTQQQPHQARQPDVRHSAQPGTPSGAPASPRTRGDGESRRRPDAGAPQ